MAAPIINLTRTTSGANVDELETASFTPGGTNRGLLVCAGTAHSPQETVTSCKFGSTAGSGGISLGSPIATLSAQTYFHVSAFKLLESDIASVGTGTIWTQFSDVAWECGLAVYALEDLNQSTPFGTVVTSDGNGATPDISATVSSAVTEIVLDFIARFAGTQNVGAGQTQAFQVSGIGGGFMIAGSSQAGASSVDMTWSDGGGGTPSGWEYIQFAVAAKEVGGGGGGGGGYQIPHMYQGPNVLLRM